MTIQSRYSKQYTDNFDKVFRAMCQHEQKSYWDSAEEFGVRCDHCGKEARIPRTSTRKWNVKQVNHIVDQLNDKLMLS